MALDEVDAHRARRLEHGDVLHLLGDQPEVQRARHADDGAHHRLVHGVAAEVAHEGTVDLQVVHRQRLQVREAAEVRAEVVEREAAAHAVQHLDEAARLVEVADHRGLGDLEADLRRRDAGAVELVHDELEECRVGERLRRRC